MGVIAGVGLGQLPERYNPPAAPPPASAARSPNFTQLIPQSHWFMGIPLVVFGGFGEGD
jgi:hypothetical protein